MAADEITVKMEEVKIMAGEPHRVNFMRPNGLLYTKHLETELGT